MRACRIPAAWIVLPWLVMTAGCDTVFGLSSRDASESPDGNVDGVVDAAVSCATETAALVCADFDTAASGIGQFSIGTSMNGNVSISEVVTDAPTPPNALRARIDATSAEYVLASVAAPRSSTNYTLELEIEPTNIGNCGTTFVYLEFVDAANSYVRRTYLTIKKDALFASVAESPTNVLQTKSLNIAWSGWTPLTIRVHPADAVNTVVIEVAGQTLELGDPGFAVAVGYVPRLRFGANAGCVTSLLFDHVVLWGL